MRIAAITLKSTLATIHMRPCEKIAAIIKGKNVKVSFRRDKSIWPINPSFAITDLMGAVAGLGLNAGSTFTLACEGEEQDSVFAEFEELFRCDAMFGGTQMVEIENP